MLKIMIVDDREIFRRQFKRFPIFKDSKEYEVAFEAQNGQEALDILEQERVDILITDIRMPIMSGLELLQTVKKRKLCNCVILLSEYSDFSYAKDGIVYGAFDYIVKPVDNETLTAVLDRCAGFIGSMQKKNVVGNNSLRLMPKLILKNDEYTATAARQIADFVLSENAGDIKACREDYQHFLNTIREPIEEKRSYMRNYCSFDELFELPEYAGPDIDQVFLRKIEEIRKKLNAFNVTTKNELIQTVCNTVIRNIEEKMSLQNVADMHFVNKAYLSHLFKIETGMSFLEFLTTVKMERAKYLLRYTEDKVYEISLRLGYEDSEYFSRIFRQNTGMTPTEYRENGIVKI